MVAIVEPLDFETIFVNYFAGNMTIFIFVAAFVFMYLAASYRMPGRVFFVMMCLFVIMLAGVAGGAIAGIYTMTIIFVGIGIYYIWGKIIKS